MEENILQITDNLYLSAPGTQPGDADALVLYLNDEEVVHNLNAMPYPYTLTDAQAFFDLIAKEQEMLKQLHVWAIRDKNMRLIGGISIHPVDTRGALAPHAFKAEVGYWLAPEHWNKGYMKQIIPFFSNYVFYHWPTITKLYAYAFTRNAASARVLERCHFVWEGTLKNHYQKDGLSIDAFAYALMRG